MMFLDLAELDDVFQGAKFWSVEGFALAQFKRTDFHGDPAIPLDQAVRQKIAKETGVYPKGAIRLLANIRYFGYIINPIACYYCFDDQEQLQFVVAEVNNTPWDERHSYVLQCDPKQKYQRIKFNKAMHVSPFNSMDIEYNWRSSLPSDVLRIHMQNWRQENDSVEAEMEFDATLVLDREEITPKGLNKLIWQYPLMTIKVVVAIYWEALRLFAKGVSVNDHPNKNTVDK